MLLFFFFLLLNLLTIEFNLIESKQKEIFVFFFQLEIANKNNFCSRARINFEISPLLQDFLKKKKFRLD